MPLEPITTKLERIFELTPTVRTFRLRFPEGKWAPFKPGQFCSIHIPGPDKVHRKPYSICSAPHEKGYIDLCIKLVEGGQATHWFWEKKVGDEIVITLPYGGFLIKEPIDYDFVFIATGTGITPLRSMILTLFHDRLLPAEKNVWLIFGVRHENEILYDNEWKQLATRHKNFNYIPTVSRPKQWQGEVGYVQEKLKKFVPDPKGKQIYVCGLVPMITAVEQAAQEVGFDKSHVHFEKYV